MPNWCNNVVEISHEDPAMMQRVKTSYLNGSFLNEFIPVPKDLSITAGNVGEKGSPEQILHEKQVESNIKKYGYSDWYNYCVNEWGTKWDIGGNDGVITENGNEIILSFDSAWAPPCVAYEKLVEMGFSVRAYYDEPGMAFCGVWEDGIDDYYEYSDMSSDDVENMLPEPLNEMFNISENMAEWEAENEEENE